jgi:hypothetical protein
LGLREKLHDGERVRATGGKAKEWWGSTGRPLSEAYARRAGGYAKRGGTLVLTGSASYLKRMDKHLKKEHPSTKRRLKYYPPKGAGYFCHYCHRPFKSSKRRDAHQRRCPIKRRMMKLGR